MANKLRGEVEVKLFGETFVLRPDTQSICEIDDAAADSTSVLHLFALGIGKRVFTLKGISLVLFGCIRAAGYKQYTLKQVMEEVRTLSMAEFVGPVGQLLGDMVSKEEVEAEEVKPVPEPLPQAVVKPPTQASTG